MLLVITRHKTIPGKHICLVTDVLVNEECFHKSRTNMLIRYVEDSHMTPTISSLSVSICRVIPAECRIVCPSDFEDTRVMLSKDGLKYFLGVFHNTPCWRSKSWDLERNASKRFAWTNHVIVPRLLSKIYVTWWSTINCAMFASRRWLACPNRIHLLIGLARIHALGLGGSTPRERHLSILAGWAGGHCKNNRLQATKKHVICYVNVIFGDISNIEWLTSCGICPMPVLCSQYFSILFQILMFSCFNHDLCRCIIPPFVLYWSGSGGDVGLRVQSHELAKINTRSRFWSMTSEQIQQFILCILDLHGLAQIYPQEYPFRMNTIQNSNTNCFSYLICGLYFMILDVFVLNKQLYCTWHI